MIVILSIVVLFSAIMIALLFVLPAKYHLLIFVFISVVWIVLFIYFARLMFAHSGAVPFDEKKIAQAVGESSFYAQLEVACQSRYVREIGIIIDPPLPIDSVMDAKGVVSGNVDVLVKMSGGELREELDLAALGRVVSSAGVWMIPLVRYSSLDSASCNGNEDIFVEAKNISFSLSEHSVFVYVSRDRRP